MGVKEDKREEFVGTAMKSYLGGSSFSNEMSDNFEQTSNEGEFSKRYWPNYRGDSLVYEEYHNGRIVVLTISGKVNEIDIDTILPRIEDRIRRWKKINLLEIVKSFDGFDLEALWKGLKFDSKHLKDFSRVAVIVEPGWIDRASRFFSSILPTELRVFSPDEIKLAEDWLGIE